MKKSNFFKIIILKWWLALCYQLFVVVDVLVYLCVWKAKGLWLSEIEEKEEEEENKQ